MKSERPTLLKGLNGKTVTISCDSLKEIKISLNLLANLLSLDLTGIVRQFKLHVLTTPAKPPLAIGIQTLLQKTCDDLLAAIHAKETTHQTFTALEESFEESWTYQLRSWRHWSPRTETANETQLKHSMFILFYLIEYLYRAGLMNYSSQLRNAAQLINNDLSGINEVISHHDKEIRSMKKNCLDKLNEMKQQMERFCVDSAWRESLTQLDNRRQGLIFKFTKAIDPMRTLRHKLNFEILQTCVALANEKYDLMREANQVLLTNKNERTLEKLTDLETKCYAFKQKVKSISEIYIHDIEQLQSGIVTHQKELLAVLQECNNEHNHLLSQFAMIDASVTTLTKYVKNNVPSSDRVIQKIEKIKLKARQSIEKIITDAKQYQEGIVDQLNFFIDEAKDQKSTSIELHKTYEEDAQELKLIIEKINDLCPQVTHPNFIADNDNHAKQSINDVLKQYYRDFLIVIYNIRAYQYYLKAAFTKVEEIKPTADIPKSYTKMKAEVNALIQQFTSIYDELLDEPTLMMRREKETVKKFGIQMNNIFSSLQQYQGYIENAADIDVRRLVEKNLDIYTTLPFNRKKQHSTVLDEIQKQKMSLTSKKEEKIYQAIRLQPTNERPAAPLGEKLIYLKERCKRYCNHLAWCGKSAAKKLKIANFLYQTLDKPTEVDRADQIRAFESQVNFFEKQLIVRRSNPVTDFLKSMICFLLPFDAIKKRVYRIEGVDFVNDVKSVAGGAPDEAEAGTSGGDSTGYITSRMNEIELLPMPFPAVPVKRLTPVVMGAEDGSTSQPDSLFPRTDSCSERLEKIYPHP